MAESVFAALTVRRSLHRRQRWNSAEKVIYRGGCPALKKQHLSLRSWARGLAIQHQDEEEAELEEIAIKQMSAVELMTIVGAKGLSAEHVIIIGFDNVNMGRITRNAFYVAMTRARKSLHLITALQAGGATGHHQFFDRLPDANLDFSKYAKGNRAQVILQGRQGFLQYLASLGAQKRRR